MGNKRWLFYTFLSLIISALIAVPASAQQLQSYPDIPGLDSLKTSVDSLLREHKVPGAGIALVQKDSVIWAGGVGYANYETNQPVKADDLFRVGSVSKTFVSLGLLQLVQQGRLHLDDKVHELVPEVEINNPWRKTDPVRVKHLLEHTSGFDDMHLNEMYNTEDDPRIPIEQALAVNTNSQRSTLEAGDASLLFQSWLRRGGIYYRENNRTSL
jgi:CubicO group peptidase (beta-lactamase class C family)